MYRSASWNSDEYYSNSSAQAPLRSSSSFDGNELPSYDPAAEMAKREKSRVKIAESAVHVIPFVLLLCAFILWFFSNPEIELGLRGETMAAKNIQRLTIDGEIESETDATQNALLDTTDSDFDSHSSKHSLDPAFPHKLGLRRRIM